MRLSDLDRQNNTTEENLCYIIDACSRTIDWSVDLYFQTLKKSVKLFVEKITNNHSYSFFDGFTSFYLNDTELTHLVKGVEEHINNEIIRFKDNMLPAVRLTGYKPVVSFKYLIDVINEQRNTIKLTKQAEKALSGLAFKTLSGFAPAIVPRRWLANPGITQKITRAMAMDTESQYSFSRQLIEQHIVGLLNNVEQDIKQNLKFQLAEQLYQWYDEFKPVGMTEMQQVINK